MPLQDRPAARDASTLFEPLEPRAMLTGDFAVAWNGAFINTVTAGSDFGLTLTAPTSAPLTPPDLNVGDKMVPKNKSDLTKVRPVMTIGNVGVDTIRGQLYFDYYLRPAAALDDSTDVLLFHKTARGKLQDSTKNVVGQKPRSQVDIKNLNFAIPLNLPAGDYVLVGVITKKYDTPSGAYQKNAKPLADADDNAANNTAISEPFTVLTPTFNLFALVDGDLTDVPTSVEQGKTAQGVVTVRVYNNGTGKVVGGAKVDVSLYLRPSGALDDSQDVAVGTLKNLSVANLNFVGSTTPNRVAYVKFSTSKVKDTLAAGTYDLIAIVDPLTAPASGSAYTWTATSGKLTEIAEKDNSATVGSITVV